MPTSNGPAAAPPWFFTVLVTETLNPGARASGAAVAAVTTRSGPTRIGANVAPTSLAWVGESASTIEPSALACATTQYLPGARDGTGNSVFTVAAPPPGIEGTGAATKVSGAGCTGDPGGASTGKLGVVERNSR